MNRMNKKVYDELRADARIEIEMRVVCQPYTSHGKMRMVEGIMRNFSSQGSYIEINRKFKPGTILIVRTVGCLPTPSLARSDEKPRSICLGEIKWEQDLTDEKECLYGMGLRYLD